MKKYYLFIALAMVAAINVSCKNSNKKAENNEATEEVVEAAKTILTDDVLATIDEIGKTYFDEISKTSFSEIFSSHLTEEEKLVKPDYLLNPSEVINLVTKTQKINAMAILTADRIVMKAYDMPIEETNEAIARLMTEVGAPLSLENQDNMTISEKVVAQYEKCKESGDLALFWQYNFAIMNEFGYIKSQNPDLFYGNISEEQFMSYETRVLSSRKVVKTLAEYDPEVKLAWDTYLKYSKAFPDESAWQEAYGTIDAAKKTASSNKESYAARRADMLK